MHFGLVVVVLLAGTTSSCWAFEEPLPSDTDLFLDDDSGSGHGKFDVDTTGSGSGPEDDEDNRLIEKKLTTTKAPPVGKDVFKNNEHTVVEGGSFFQQPGILAAIICGAIVGLLCAILLVMFIVYRMRKKDEGSYVLEDSKRTSSYGKSKEFFA